MTTLPSGVEAGFSAAGDPLAQRLVLFCLPTPGGGVFDPDPVLTSRYGVHLVSLDRPGYGATSAAQPGTRIQDRADDLAAFLTALQSTARQAGATVYGPTGVVGWGTGGLVALSLAARHPDLVDRVATVQAASPPGFTFDPSVHTPPPFRPEVLGIPSADPLLERPGLRNRLERMLAEGARQGDAGVRLDREALRDASWADELGRIRAQVRLIYADDLTAVDRYDGYWYRRRIPSAGVVRISSGGALAIATEWGRILDHVAPEHADPAAQPDGPTEAVARAESGAWG